MIYGLKSKYIVLIKNLTISFIGLIFVATVECYFYEWSPNIIRVDETWPDVYYMAYRWRQWLFQFNSKLIKKNFSTDIQDFDVRNCKTLNDVTFASFSVFGPKTEPDKLKTTKIFIFISILPQMDIRGLTRFLPMICSLHLYCLVSFLRSPKNTRNTKILNYWFFLEEKKFKFARENVH